MNRNFYLTNHFFKPSNALDKYTVFQLYKSKFNGINLSTASAVPLTFNKGGKEPKPDLSVCSAATSPVAGEASRILSHPP